MLCWCFMAGVLVAWAFLAVGFYECAVRFSLGYAMLEVAGCTERIKGCSQQAASTLKHYKAAPVLHRNPKPSSPLKPSTRNPTPVDVFFFFKFGGRPFC